MDLAPAANLAYQAACFERAACSGHTPALLGVLAPSAALPRGALIVEEIVGRAVRARNLQPCIRGSRCAVPDPGGPFTECDGAK